MCLVGQPGQIEVVAIVEQGDVPLVPAGSAVRVSVAQSPRGTLGGTVESVSQHDARDLPPHLVAAGLIPQRLDAQGRPRSLATMYQARIKLDDPPRTLLPGATGQVLFKAQPQTIASRISRWLGQTFRFRR